MSENELRPRDLARPEKAVGRWENEGGAAPVSPEVPEEGLPGSDGQLLRCLGSAVVLRWNDLPTVIQRDLFESAASQEDPELQQELAQRLGRFLHQRTAG